MQRPIEATNLIKTVNYLTALMTEWERIELRPLFSKLLEHATTWDPAQVLPRTKRLGNLVMPQLREYEEGKYRLDRNEGIGFFESIEKFVSTGLPLSLDHFTNLVNQYQDRITPYPHYSGIKVTIPVDLKDLDGVGFDDIPDLADDDDDQGSALKLM